MEDRQTDVQKTYQADGHMWIIDDWTSKTDNKQTIGKDNIHTILGGDMGDGQKGKMIWVHKR